MRYVILGAGAVGGTMGGLLHRAGRDVVLIARGPHLAAMRAGGLRLRTPDEDLTIDVPVAGSADEAGVARDDVVLLATKTQDTVAALDDLRAAAPATVTVVCAQNAVENERLALRHYADVHGMLVYLPAEHLAPGEVVCSCAPVAGVLDVGRYPHGTDARDERIAADLEAAGFSSLALTDVMAWKHSKLLSNLGNAVDAALGPGQDEDERVDVVLERARAEALSCFAAAGIDVPSEATVSERRKSMSPTRPVSGQERAGGSTWQSLARGLGSTEVDYLNGEVALLGRLHGVETPVNVALQRIVGRLARERSDAGSLSVAALLAEIDGTQS
jgi:2-dehydropantoate 2-reductase